MDNMHEKNVKTTHYDDDIDCPSLQKVLRMHKFDILYVKDID